MATLDSHEQLLRSRLASAAGFQESLLLDLHTIRDFFANEKNWTFGCEARNSIGRPRSWDDVDATCFCLAGAARKFGKLAPNKLIAAIDDACMDVFKDEDFLNAVEDPHAHVNDEFGYSAVISVLDFGITKAAIRLNSYLERIALG